MITAIIKRLGAEMKRDSPPRMNRSMITRTALVMVGPVFGETDFRDSDLYNPDYSHVLRNRGKRKSAA